jgi:hypothetical protein
MAHLNTAYKIGALKAARDFGNAFKDVEPSPIAGEGERPTSSMSTTFGHKIPAVDQDEPSPSYPDKPE